MGFEAGLAGLAGFVLAGLTPGLLGNLDGFELGLGGSVGLCLVHSGVSVVVCYNLVASPVHVVAVDSVAVSLPLSTHLRNLVIRLHLDQTYYEE